jgi:uncharacterized membrane protein
MSKYLSTDIIEREIGEHGPDYETQIKTIRQAVEKEKKFLAAIEEYVGNGYVSDKMEEMVGGIYLTIKRLNAAIAETIRRQQADNK